MNGFFQLQLSFTEKPKLDDDLVRCNRTYLASFEGQSSGRNKAQPARDGLSNRPRCRIYPRTRSRQKATLCRLSR